MKHVHMLVCFLSFILLTSISYAQFVDINTGLTGVSNSSVAWGDYDNDGDLDILLTGYTGSTQISIIYRNDGSGIFTDINAGLTGVYWGSSAWGDYDNDGDLDILLTGDTGSVRISRIYRNEGSGIFTDISAGLPGVKIGSSAWGDYDNDGDLDILLTGDTSSGSISIIYQNQGNGMFTDISAGLTGVITSSSAWGDYDNDGDLDILLIGDTGSGSISRIYRNDGSGIFTDIDAGLTGVHYSSVAWGDYDNDGDLDILLTGYTGSTQISIIYRNDGIGIFTDINAGLTGVTYSSSAWGDYDNDGDLDILLTGLSGSGFTSIIYRNDGSGVFTDLSAGLTGVIFGSVAWGDYDNDGDLDILLTGDPGSVRISRIYRNDYNIANLPPLTPTNLQATLDGDDVLFDWTAGTDDHTPVDGLNYVLRIGTTPGGSEISSPMSETGGWRMIPQSGYANSCSWKIKASALTAVTYYWSVQAVDTACRGSAFATELMETKFTDISAGLTVVFTSSCAWGDYDNDGDLDILLTGNTGSTRISRIYRNNGNNTFTDISAGLTGVQYSSSAWGDYDNDGDLDILLTGDTGSGRISRIYRNNGDNTFTDISAGLTGVDFSSCAWGDYDNDGDLDILLTGDTGSGYISIIYCNNGNNTFTDISAGLTGVVLSSCAWGDYDNDGDLDILLTGSTGFPDFVIISIVYRNEGSGIFTDISAGLTGVHQGSCAWGDYNNDGDLDILLTGTPGSGRISRIYRNDGNNTFTDISAGLAGVGLASCAWGDYDNDGDLDILLTGSTGSGYIARIYRNEGGGTFTDIDAGLTGVIFGSVAWGDYDNDGDLDILLTGSIGSEYISKIYRNDYNIANLPPASPTNLQATLDGDVVEFSWTAATDDHTPADGLNYVLRIGTTPGGSEISSPMSESGGWRMIPQPGYANSCSWKIGMAEFNEPDPYYWSVQTVDTAFRGSAFAGEQVLTSSIPLPPENVQITTQGESTVISWDAVTQTISGTPFVPDYYIIFYNDSSEPNEGAFYYLDTVYSTSMVHDGILLLADNMFYHVRAFKDYSSRGIMSRTPDLNGEMTEAEVLRLLK